MGTMIAYRLRLIGGHAMLYLEGLALGSWARYAHFLLTSSALL